MGMRLQELSKRGGMEAQPGLAVRLMVLHAFSKAHSNRIQVRLQNLGTGNMPAPVPCPGAVPSDVRQAMLQEAALAQKLEARYQALAVEARAQGDLSTVWVCDINATESKDCARELRRYSEGWVEPFPQAIP